MYVTSPVAVKLLESFLGNFLQDGDLIERLSPFFPMQWEPSKWGVGMFSMGKWLLYL